MKIKNILDFENKADDILKDYKDNNIELKKQNQILNSEIMNSNFEKIENTLNNIYEETRRIKELINFSKIYVSNEIEKSIDTCKKTLNIIENLNDDLYNEVKNFITINVELINDDNKNLFFDRNGEELNYCNIYDKKISLSGEINNSIKIKAISVRRQEQVYESNENNLTQDKPYRTSYILDSICKNGIKEIITFLFENSIDLNSINVKLSNCNIKEIYYIYENGTKVIDIDTKQNLIPQKKVIGVELILESSNYAIKEMNIDNTNNDNFNNINKIMMEDYKNMKEKDDNVYNKEYNTITNKELDNIYLKEVK